MTLDEVRDLKQRAITNILEPMASASIQALSLAVAAKEMKTGQPQPKRLMALGVSRSAKGKGYKLAVRLQRHSMLDRPEIAKLKRMAGGEIDIRFVGRIEKRATPWYQKPQRPLLIGCSVGHHKITAGTLGAFVRPIGAPEGPLAMLSNNHVLANENKAKVGDLIVQPGPLDGDENDEGVVAKLTRFVRLKKRGNLVDCAMAQLEAGIEARLRQLRGLGGSLKGLSQLPLDEGLRVGKVGRTTGATRGRITAFELDDVIVAFGAGNISFDGQIEIEGEGDASFSDGGDSGSLIVDEEFGAIGLLFAGSDSGGTNGRGLTYANPIAAVLSAMKVELALR
jgi:hypothetical protein